jgi:hypothetical protein
VLGAPPAQIDPAGAHDAHRVGVQRLGVAPGAARLDRATAEPLGQRLGHLRAGAVAGAQEEHARARARDRVRRRRQPQPGVQRLAGRREQRATAREVEAVVRLAAVGRAAPRRDEAVGSQARQVVGDEALRSADEPGELADLAVAARQLGEEPPAQRVTREAQEAGWWGGGRDSHTGDDTSNEIDGSSIRRPTESTI